MADEMTNGTVIKSEDVAIFIKDTETYFRLQKSTGLEITSDTETEEKKFIADKNTTVFSKATTIALSNDLYTIKGEADYEFFFKKWVDLINKNPEDIDVLVVYKAHGDASTGYQAWHFPETKLVFTSYNAVDSTLNFDFNFGQGETGTVTMSDGTPTFQKGA